jgi:hypothetical protein
VAAEPAVPLFEPVSRGEPEAVGAPETKSGLPGPVGAAPESRPEPRPEPLAEEIAQEPEPRPEPPRQVPVEAEPLPAASEPEPEPAMAEVEPAPRAKRRGWWSLGR